MNQSQLEDSVSLQESEITDETSIDDIVKSIENSTSKKNKKKRRKKNKKTDHQKDLPEEEVSNENVKEEAKKTLPVTTVTTKEDEKIKADVKASSTQRFQKEEQKERKPAQSAPKIKQDDVFRPRKIELTDSFWDIYNSSVSSGSDNESLPDYKEGGYHPVHIGETFNKRYRVLKKLGFGAFSTVWFCHDMFHNKFVAIKVQKSEESYYSAAEDEIEILDKIVDNIKTEEWKESIEEYNEPNNINSAHCLHMMDHFTFEGPHGKHIGMVFEVMGHNLLKVMKLYDWDGIPLPIARTLARQTLIGLDYLHRLCNVIHTDIKPENAILCPNEKQLMEHLDTIPDHFKTSIQGPIQSSMFFSKEQNKINKRKKKNKPKKKENKNTEEDKEEDEKKILDESVQVKLCDFGNGCWIDHHFTSNIQTRQYRSPEVILGGEYNETCDLWSYACMVFELITGDYLFHPKKRDDCSKEDDHIAFIIELIGKPELKWLKQCKRYRKFFTTRGRMKKIFHHKIWKLKEILIDKYCFKEEEAEPLADFLMQALQWKNEDRKSAQEMLRHPWLSMPSNYDYLVEGSDDDESQKEDDDTASWVTVSSDEESDADDEESEADDEDKDNDSGSTSSYDLC
ncbi:unnamed protein product [Moneuplotes crassus]|uniref:non-specific serine/threonine protein kinase n=1 Tax=Euplotes crassus TaxID=5936 RepID=A0AAD1U7K5_EUPCR|nr:unnamed protein product [Moneuplotes crassus]